MTCFCNSGKKIRIRRSALGVALAFALANGAYGQATTATIFGRVPAAAGETIVATGASGVERSVQVDAQGRYTLSALPVGRYTVTLMRNGEPVATRKGVTTRVGAGTDVSFAQLPEQQQEAKNLSAVTVSASALPSIDVTAVDSRTVITAEQLARLPLVRSAEAIAMLAPGTVAGSGHFSGPTGNGLVSFGGSSVTENAYYINGMNVTDPLNGLGGISLPYGSVEQEEVLTGGYSAAYGRSDGGVINQVGKRGTNEWHFGGQILWTPKSLRASGRNIYFSRAAGADAGSLYNYNRDDKGWTAVESAYLGGPLIKDRLFMFASVEASKSNSAAIGSKSSSSTETKYQYLDPKWYAKLDWNITSNSILELTGASTKHDYQGNNYRYDYDSFSRGGFLSQSTHTKTAASMWIAKYTGYITDNLTVTAQYGKQKTDLYSELPSSFNPDLAPIYGASQENPALSGGGGGITNTQTVYSATDPGHQTRGANYRVDVTWKLGDHTLTAGIDNQRTQDLDDGSYNPTTAGFAWAYARVDPATTDIVAGAVDAPAGYAGGENGYYVSKYVFKDSASVRVEQRAQYVEDTWQVNDRWLVKVGLRNDQFTNYNNDNEPYIRQHSPQWAPRLGVSWDVNGDSSFKVYANAGRYYLAMPTSVALRGANGSLYQDTYYTYTGIDSSTGYPTGLTPIGTVNGAGVPYSANGEDGTPPDPKTVTASSLKSEYQDEYILGFDRQFDKSLTYGARLSYRTLRNAIDDTCEMANFTAEAVAQGVNPDYLHSCYFINPGRANTFRVSDGHGGYDELHLSNAQLGFPHLKRSYYALDMYLEHPFDGHWWGKIEYTFSRSFGNSEGQVKSDTGQGDIAATIDWDYPEMMVYANGRLPNDRTHQLKAYGSWQITPEWNLSGNVSIVSGTPTSCMGLYGPQQSSEQYGNGNYHWCNGLPVPAGSAGNLPWEKQLSLNLEYRPAFADHKLGFNVYVFNVFNEQKETMISETNDSNYRLVEAYETPRYVRFGVTYDF